MHNRKLKYFLLFLLICSVNCITQGQNRKIDSLNSILKTAKEDSNKVKILNTLSWTFCAQSNYNRADSFAKEGLQLAEKLNFKKGEADAYGNKGSIYCDMGNYAAALKYDSLHLKVSLEINYTKGVEIADNNFGNIYYYQGNYPEALKEYLLCLKLDEQMGNRKAIGNEYGNIGLVYYSLGNYPDALRNQLQCASIDSEFNNKYGIDNTYGNIGKIYYAMKNYPLSLKYYMQSLEIALKIIDKQGVAIIYQGIGLIYSKQKAFSEAAEYYLKDLKIVKDIGDKRSTGDAYESIGETFFQLKEYEKARKYLDSSLVISKQLGAKLTLQYAYYCYALIDSTTGNYKALYHDYVKYNIYKDSLNNEENTKRIVSEQMTYEFDKKTDSIKAEHAKQDIIGRTEIRRKSIITNSALVIMALTVLSAILLVRSLRIKRKKDEITITLSEKEKDLLRIEKQYVEEKLVNASSTLDAFTKSMVEKNELLEQFKTDVEKLRNLKSKELEEVRVEQLEYLSKSTILTEEDWNKFKNYFEQVYKGYFIRLKEKLPDLTQAEIRLVCLTKLKLDSKQMANILGVSFDTIRITRYRLRKKLGLSEGEGIDDISESI